MEWIKVFWIMDLVKKEWSYKQAIHKNKSEYIPVMISDAGTRARMKAGKQEKPYRIQYVRLKDIMQYIKQETWKELIFKWEEKTKWWLKEDSMKDTNRK